MPRYRLWPSTDGPGSPTTDSTNYTLGVTFTVSSPQYLYGYYFWHASGQGGGTKDFRTWQVSGASAVSGTDASIGSWSTGWNYVALATPVLLSANTEYRAGISIPVSPANGYSSTGSYFTGTAVTNGPLTAPAAGSVSDTNQGSFIVSGPLAFPNSSFSDSNYWLDVEVGTDDSLLPLSPGWFVKRGWWRPVRGPADLLAGGTVFTADLSGSLTPTGALTRQDQKALTGSSTPSGALANQSQKILTGSSAPTGALLMLVGKLLAGTSTPSGALARQDQKLLSGSSTSSGALATAVVKVISLAGLITPSGTLMRLVGKSLAGSLSPAGALLKLISRLLGGSVVPAGTLGTNLITVELYFMVPSRGRRVPYFDPQFPDTDTTPLRQMAGINPRPPNLWIWPDGSGHEDQLPPGGYTPETPIYYGGARYGPLTQRQVDQLTLAGYAGFITTDPNMEPAP